jgi:hypothetical protein
MGVAVGTEVLCAVGRELGSLAELRETSDSAASSAEASAPDDDSGGRGGDGEGG